MHFPRASGVLLHPTCLPGRYGIGDLGEAAYRFVDFLASTGQTAWQVLPLGPTSYGDSPYQALSTFAGNTLLISLDRLLRDGWLTEAALAEVPNFSVYLVDYGNVISYHDKLLSFAFERFEAAASTTVRGDFETWCAQQDWLDDFALFMAIKDSYNGQPWVEWPESERIRQAVALDAARQKHARRIAEHRFRQWLFFAQWAELKAYANSKGVRLIGDIPIFVAHDSSDVWSNQALFYLEASGQPTVVAGVPPDYFSQTGQRWGNPLYRWDRMAAEGYAWWVRRFRSMLKLVDIIRIDHFRGFEAYWEVPASEETAINGRWVPGPGDAFFRTVSQELGELPIIAEDLGVITPGVEKLRDDYRLPGMKVLQFAFSDACLDSEYLPHNYVPNCVVYTGTHDNDTTLGWWQHSSKEIKECVKHYLGHDVGKPHWDLIRLAMMSVAYTVIVPMQDVLGFGSNTRMNTPGVGSGNWAWRFTGDWLESKARERLAKMTRLYGRWPKAPEAETPAPLITIE